MTYFFGACELYNMKVPKVGMVLKKNWYCGMSVEGGNTCGICIAVFFQKPRYYIFCIRYFRKNFPNKTNIKKNKIFEQKTCKHQLKYRETISSLPISFRYFVFRIFSKAAVSCIVVKNGTCGNTEIPKYRAQYRKCPPLEITQPRT